MRWLASLALLIAGTGLGWAQSTSAPTPAQWIADKQTGCKVWNPYPHPNEAVSWSGTCKSGLADGHGVLKWSQDGQPAGRYEGDYREGKVNGQGTMIWPDGGRYVGEWRDDQRNGHGVQTWANGDHYVGEYRDDKLNGQGSYSWPDGSRYVGEWRDDQRNGHGMQTWTDGSHYEGDYRDGKAQGQGKYVNGKGEMFEGGWANGCFHDGDRRAAVGASSADCGF